MVECFTTTVALAPCFSCRSTSSSLQYSSSTKKNRQRSFLESTNPASTSSDESSSSSSSDAEEQLASFLHNLLSSNTDTSTKTNNNNNDRLACGFDCTDSERATISKMVDALLLSPTNLVQSTGGNIPEKSLLGEWNLLYTSSRTMMINKSLSGLGRSSSSMAKVASIRQKLSGSKYLGFVEYIEHIGGSEADDGFDVTVTGEWFLEPETNPFTGEPTTAIRLDLEKVMYGPTTNDAETWASLGPIKLLDIVYLSDNLQITRGNANPDSIFVLQRIIR